MSHWLFRNDFQELNRLTQRLDKDRRELTLSLGQSRTVLGRRLTTPWGLSFCFLAGFGAKNWVTKSGRAATRQARDRLGLPGLIKLARKTLLF